MSELRAEGIIKTYGKKDVLHGVDLILESGKIYGLIGRNGAGKTTLLSILTSQNPASKGSVTYNGEPVWENPVFFERTEPDDGKFIEPDEGKRVSQDCRYLFPTLG